MMMRSREEEARLLRLEETVGHACEAIYRQRQGYWPSVGERHNIAIALVTAAAFHVGPSERDVQDIIDAIETRPRPSGGGGVTGASRGGGGVTGASQAPPRLHTPSSS